MLSWVSLKKGTVFAPAIRSYEQALRLDIDHQPTLETLAALYRAAGRGEVAEALEVRLK